MYDPLLTCPNNITILDALNRIDVRKKSFLIVLNEDLFVGTLTDGDIRRALIKGCSLNDSICNAYQKNAITISCKKTIDDVIEIFKIGKIKFVPILDGRKLVNIITKPQLQTILLQNIEVDLSYDFSSLDTNIINTEIFIRPWGFYKTTVLNEYYQAKIITVKPNKQLSLQSHKYRDEYWTINYGEGKITLNNETVNVKPGDMFFIPRGMIHRIKNTNSTKSLIINEVQLGEYFGEDDIVRYEDDYGRK